MNKRTHSEGNETAEAINAENAEHEGRPRTMSAERAQESWEEFKQRANHAAEEVLEEVTDPQALKVRARQAKRQARHFFRSYRTYVIAGATLVTAAALYWAFKPEPKKKMLWGLFS